MTRYVPREGGDRTRKSMARGISLRTQLLVSFVLVALLPGLLIAGAITALGPRGVLSRFGGSAGVLDRVSGIGLSIVIVLISVAVALGTGLLLTQRMSRRLDRVLKSVTEIAAGHLGQHVPVDGGDEISQLAVALNRMTGRWAAQMDDLEEGVAARSVDLARRSVRLETAVRIAREVADLQVTDGRHHRFDPMLQTAVDEIAVQLGYSHVGLYLLDDARRFLVLRASSPGAGRDLVKRGFRLAADDDSLIARAVVTGEPCKANDATESTPRHRLPDGSQPEPSAGRQEAELRPDGLEVLEETRSEICLPLRMRGGIAGVLDIRSSEAIPVASEADRRSRRGGDLPTTSEDGVAFLQIMADQIGLALEHAQLLDGAEEQVREFGRLVRVERQEGWRQMLSSKSHWAFVYDGLDVSPLDEAVAIAAPDLTLPLGSSDERLGTIKVVAGQQALDAKDVALAEAIARETGRALERARLLRATQDALHEAGILYRCSRAMVEARSPRDVLAAIVGHVASFDEKASAPIDRGFLLLRDTVVPASAYRLRIESAIGGVDDADGLVGQVWPRNRLPILGWDVPGAVAGVGITALGDIEGDDLLDTASRETLLGEMGLRAALIVPLCAAQPEGRHSDGAARERNGADGDGRQSSDIETQALGWFVIGSTAHPYEFSDREVRIYRGAADLAATVIQNMQVLDLSTERARRAQLVGGISTRVRETLDMDLILQTALREIGDNLGISSIEVQMQRRTETASAGGADDAGGSIPTTGEAAETERDLWEG